VRSTVAALLLLGLGIACIYVICLVRKHWLTLALAIVATAMAALYLLQPLLNALGQSAEYLQANRQFISVDATTGFASAPLGSGPLGLITSAVQMVPRIVLGPFPWEVGFSAVWLWVIANDVIWIVALVIMIRRTRLLSERRVIAVLIIAGAIVLTGMALTLTNYGIVIRMRGIPYVMILPILIARAGARGGRNDVVEAPLVQTSTAHAPVSAANVQPAAPDVSQIYPAQQTPAISNSMSKPDWTPYT
jgi:hypothetical protein